MPPVTNTQIRSCAAKDDDAGRGADSGTHRGSRVDTIVDNDDVPSVAACGVPSVAACGVPSVTAEAGDGVWGSLGVVCRTLDCSIQIGPNSFNLETEPNQTVYVSQLIEPNQVQPQGKPNPKKLV